MNKLMIWVVYFNTIDFPNKYVSRRFELDQASKDVIVSSNLKVVRKWINLQSHIFDQGEPYRMLPDQQDDPVILETWF